MKSNCQGSKAETLIVQSPVVFVVVTQPRESWLCEGDDQESRSITVSLG